MSERERQTMSLNRQSILAVTGVGVGLLTLVYVLGVQVGKRSAALRGAQPGKAGEELDELPKSLKDQLKVLEQGRPAPEPAKPTTPAPDPAASPAEGATPPAPEAKPEAKPESKEPEKPKEKEKEKEKAGDAVYTLQIISTPDAAEAKRVAGKAKLMGLECVVVKEKGLHKVQLAKLGTLQAVTKTKNRLAGAGYKTFILKRE